MSAKTPTVAALAVGLGIWLVAGDGAQTAAEALEQLTQPTVQSSSQEQPAGSAQAQLESLPVTGRAPKTGYDRAEFGQAWSDAGTKGVLDGARNGCDTRNDILRRDLTQVTIKPGSTGCVVTTGILEDPFTGQQISFERGPRSRVVQVDHLVSLSNAWQTGAQQLDEQQRLDLANDPLNLLAVDGPQNAAKGDSDAATWLPPTKSFRCEYVARQIAVKARHQLWVTPPEKKAMSRVLTSCPGQPSGQTQQWTIPALSKDGTR